MLVVHFKPSGSLPNMAEEVSKLIIGDKDRVKYLTWGRHTATNEYSGIKHVILLAFFSILLPRSKRWGEARRSERRRKPSLMMIFCDPIRGDSAQHSPGRHSRSR